MKILKNIFLVVILVAVIILSFWLSFTLGKNILVPTKKVPSSDFLTVEASVLDNIGRITFEVDSVTVEASSPETEEDYMLPKVSTSIKTKKEKVSPSPVKAKRSTETVSSYSSSLVIQLGIFSSYENAKNLAKSLNEKGYYPKISNYGKYHRVYILSGTMAEAQKIAGNIKSEGFEAIVRRK